MEVIFEGKGAEGGREGWWIFNISFTQWNVKAKHKGGLTKWEKGKKQMEKSSPMRSDVLAFSLPLHMASTFLVG